MYLPKFYMLRHLFEKIPDFIDENLKESVRKNNSGQSYITYACEYIIELVSNF